MNTFRRYAYKASENHTKTLWVLKCDIRKFFASIDQPTLLKILRRRISDERTITLLQVVIDNFHSTESGKGLPLGNLTSQLLVNIYMNKFDQFVKHKLKVRYYVRYADDFVFLSHDRNELCELLPYIVVFLRERLKLELHPNKVSIATLASGINFLGWVHFPTHRVLRTSTKRRMFRCLSETMGGAVHKLQKLTYRPEFVGEPVRMSYLGMLSHGNAHKLARLISQSPPE